MTWKAIIKNITPEDRQVVQDFFDAIENFEVIFDEGLQLRNAGRLQTEEQALPEVKKQILALKQIQATSMKYVQRLEETLS